jgi:hypothetical protein
VLPGIRHPLDDIVPKSFPFKAFASVQFCRPVARTTDSSLGVEPFFDVSPRGGIAALVQRILYAVSTAMRSFRPRALASDFVECRSVLELALSFRV